MVLLIFPYLVADATRLGWEALSLSSTNGQLRGRVVANGRRVVIDNVMPGLLCPVNVAGGGAQAAKGANNVSVWE